MTTLSRYPLILCIIMLGMQLPAHASDGFPVVQNASVSELSWAKGINARLQSVAEKKCTALDKVEDYLTVLKSIVYKRSVHLSIRDHLFDITADQIDRLLEREQRYLAAANKQDYSQIEQGQGPSAEKSEELIMRHGRVTQARIDFQELEDEFARQHSWVASLWARWPVKVGVAFAGCWCLWQTGKWIAFEMKAEEEKQLHRFVTIPRKVFSKSIRNAFSAIESDINCLPEQIKAIGSKYQEVKESFDGYRSKYIDTLGDDRAELKQRLTQKLDAAFDECKEMAAAFVAGFTRSYQDAEFEEFCRRHSGQDFIKLVRTKRAEQRKA